MVSNAGLRKPIWVYTTKQPNSDTQLLGLAIEVEFFEFFE
jgi:hypothetical protein